MGSDVCFHSAFDCLHVFEYYSGVTLVRFFFSFSSFIRLMWAVLGSRGREITSSYQYIRLNEDRVINNLFTMKERAVCRAPEKSRVMTKFVLTELVL